MARNAVLLAGVLLGLGCTPTEPSSVEALQAGLARWEALGPSDYDMVVHRGPCECQPRDIVSVTVHVRSGEIESVSNYQTGELVDIQPFHAMTVEAMFGLIDSALTQNAHRVAVHYDRLLGYPRAIAIDYSRDAVDDETVIAAELMP